MQIRSETHLGCRVKNYSFKSEKERKCIEQGVDSDNPLMEPQFIKLRGSSKKYINIPRLNSKFVADEDDTVAAITFSAMSNVWSTDETDRRKNTCSC